MFGRSRFEQQRFNLATSTTDVYLKAAFTEDLEGQIGAGSDIRVESMVLGGSFGIEAAGATAILTSMVLSENLQSNMAGTIAIMIENTLCGALEGSYAIGANISMDAQMLSEWLAECVIGADLYIEMDLSDLLVSVGALGADLYYSLPLQELLFTSASIEHLEESSTIVIGTIPPGAELRIDSGLFTMTLNGKNILEMHMGDWIDMDRDLDQIIINSTGRLEGTLVYKEQYL